MRKKTPQFDSSLNLDSLVDIVSNSVGILIILAVFTALLTLTPASPEKEKTPEAETEVTEKIRIPWSHISQKKSILFVIQNNRVLYLDQNKVYSTLKQKLSGNSSNFLSRLELEGYAVTLKPQSSQTHCLEFHPDPDAGEWWYQANTGKGAISRLINESLPEDRYFFFWVDEKSFELFRSIREFMWNHNFEVGWKPVKLGRQDSVLPLQYCVGFTRSLSFQPQ